MKQKTTGALIALLIVGLIGSASLVAAFPGERGNKGKNLEAKEALLAGDYELWVSAIEGTKRGEKMLEQMTEQDFEQMSEAFIERETLRAEIEYALEEGNYDAWREALANNPYRPAFMDDITEDQFDTVLAIYDAKKSEDFETAKELREDLAEELGLNPWHGKMNRYGHGMHHKMRHN